MKDIKAIGILTSGGDCGGLNAVVKGAAQMANAFGIKAYAILNGYAGLYNLAEIDTAIELNDARLEEIDITKAGSCIGNSRVKISKIDDENKYTRIKAGLARFGIDGLVISGGDDTGSVVVDLHANSIPCVHVPKTMDLDLYTYSVGGDSAINNISKAVKSVKTTGNSHNRIIIIEVFGRYAGHTTFRGGIAAEADCVLIPEVPIDFDIVYAHMKERFCSRLKNSSLHEATYTIVVAEGLTISNQLLVDESFGTDAFGHKKMGGTGKYVREQLTSRLSVDEEMKAIYKDLGLYVENMNELPEIRETAPGYLIRSGETYALDACFGRDAGAGAVLLLREGIQGVTVASIQDNKIKYIPTKVAIAQRFVNLNLVTLYEAMGVCFGREPVKPQMLPQLHNTDQWNYI